MDEHLDLARARQLLADALESMRGVNRASGIAALAPHVAGYELRVAFWADVVDGDPVEGWQQSWRRAWGVLAESPVSRPLHELALVEARRAEAYRWLPIAAPHLPPDWLLKSWEDV